jgi:hypothetical protein
MNSSILVCWLFCHTHITMPKYTGELLHIAPGVRMSFFRYASDQCLETILYFRGVIYPGYWLISSVSSYVVVVSTLCNGVNINMFAKLHVYISWDLLFIMFFLSATCTTSLQTTHLRGILSIVYHLAHVPSAALNGASLIRELAR